MLQPALQLVEGELFGLPHFPDLCEATKILAEHLAAVEEEFDKLFTGRQATETGRKNYFKKVRVLWRNVVADSIDLPSTGSYIQVEL